MQPNLQRNLFSGIADFSKGDKKSIFEGITDFSQLPSPVDKLSTSESGVPTTMAEANMILNPELGMAGGTPQESYSQLQERARASSVLAKHAVASTIGGAPDLVSTIGWDIPVMIKNYATGTNTPLAPKLTRGIEHGIDTLTGGRTKTQPRDEVLAAATEGAGSMFGGGLVGKGVKAATQKAIMGNPSKWAERAMKFARSFSGFLGSTNPSLVAAGAAAGGATEIALQSNPENKGSAMASGIGAGIGTAFLGRTVAPGIVKGVANLAGGIGGSFSTKVAEQNARRVFKDILKNENQATSIKNEVLGDLTRGDAPYVSKEVLDTFKGLPSAEAKGALAKKHMKDYVKFLMEVEERQGIELTAGEITASKKLRAKEDSFANNINIDAMGNFLTSRKIKLMEKAQKLTDSIPGSGSAYDFGVKVDAAMAANMERLKKIRSAEWDKDFGQIANEKIIPVSNFTQTLKEFAGREASNEGYKTSARIAKEKLGILQKSYPEQQLAIQHGVKVNDPLMSPKQINDWLVGFNEDLKNIPSHKRFSTQEVGKIKAALDADLALAAQAGNADAALVQNAREGFRKNSEIINQIEESYLQKKLDNLGSPERITKAFQSMEPSEIRQTISFLEGTPEKESLLKNIQKYYLEKATNAGITDDTFSVSKFLKELPKKEILEDVFKDSSLYTDLKETMMLMRRIKKYGATEGGSQTAQRLSAKEGIETDGFSTIIEVFNTHGIKSAIVSAAGKGGRSLMNEIAADFREKFVSILTSKEKRDALINDLLRVEKGLSGSKQRSALFMKKESDPHPYRKIITQHIGERVQNEIEKLKGKREDKKQPKRRDK